MYPLAALLLAAAAHAQDPPGDPATRTPATAEYRVPGADAWDAARRAGFEFRPVVPRGYILSGPPDGVRTTLKACADPLEPCRAEAVVEDGVLKVVAPACADGCTRAHDFELFAGRPLADGWALAAAEVRGDGWSWVRRPTDDDPRLTLRVVARPDAEGHARIRSITLVGPPGQAWSAAFRSP